MKAKTEGPRRKRGRPPLSVDIKILRVLKHGLTDINVVLEAMLQNDTEVVTRKYEEVMRKGGKGGRPANRALHQWLSEVVKDADRRGRKLRPCLREALERKLGRTVELEEVARCERQIHRLGLRPAKSRPTLKNELCPKSDFKNRF
jgi:hypothetical protein